MKRYKNLRSLLTLFAALTLLLPMTISCSDEPDDEYFYSFKGEMMSDYLNNRSEYSEFASIVKRANLMDLLSSYGHFTCFLPSNTAVDAYLNSRGMQSVDQLSTEDCDTIARTHLIANMYSTIEMDQDRLQTANFLGRYLSTEIDSITAEVVIEGIAHISNTLKDDSVENGIVQPIDKVIEKSNSYISDILRDNPTISYFYRALVATGVDKEIMLVEDESYDRTAYPKYYYTSDFWKEVAWVPDTKKYGYTVFVEPNEVYDSVFQARGIDKSNGILEAMYELARQEYHDVYGQTEDGLNDASNPAWSYSVDNLTNDINPLKRFVRYHILNRYVPGTSDLTPLVMHVGAVNEAFGIETTKVNPVDWFTTLLPHTMLKVDYLPERGKTIGKDRYSETDVRGERYLNRLYENGNTIPGQMISSAIDKDYVHDALNGHYFYVNDIVSFNKTVQNEVQNVRIRMDFSTIFPEVMTNDMRLKGIPTVDDNSGTPDESTTPKNGRNFYFPMGYLDGVTFTNGTLVMRRPHINFWSWQGDEWNIFGDYDFTFRIPPVPKSGNYQLRLGFCALKTRGVMQTYFDGVAQGIPLDMTAFLDEEYYIGDRFKGSDADISTYDKMSDEEKAEEQKLLKNLGAYRAGRSTYHFNTSGTKYFFTGNPRTYRRILCQTWIDANSDHYLRFRVASDGKQGNNNEFMLDYFEIVPSSVYSVDSEGAMEDDL
jgi:uncharacterized surface protein with fasciclin (FAS1) repeats